MSASCSLAGHDAADPGAVKRAGVLGVLQVKLISRRDRAGIAAAVGGSGVQAAAAPSIDCIHNYLLAAGPNLGNVGGHRTSHYRWPLLAIRVERLGNIPRSFDCICIQSAAVLRRSGWELDMAARTPPKRKSSASPARSERGRAAAGRPDMRLVEGRSNGTRIPFDVEQHLFFWFTQVISRRDNQLNAALRPYRIRVPEWRVLGLLYSRRGLSMSEVADFAAIDPTTLSRTVAQLVRAGLLVRIADAADKRITRLALTAAGTRLAERILPIVFRLNDAATAGLPDAVVGVLRWALERMRDSLDASLAGGRADTSRNEGSER